jgi:hypothetical protein
MSWVFDRAISHRNVPLDVSRASMVGYGIYDVPGHETHNVDRYEYNMGDGSGVYLNGFLLPVSTYWFFVIT